MIRRNLFVGTLLAAAVLATGCQAMPETVQSRQSMQPGPSVRPEHSVPPMQSDATQVRRSVPAGRAPHTAPVASSSQLRGTAAQPLRPPTGYEAFSLVVQTSAGDIDAPVAPLSVALETDGSTAPIDPPHATAQQWSTAAWIQQSTYPTAASTGGPSYIYGHACHHHVCSFTRLRDAATGNTVTVTTPASLLTYRICATGRSSKTGNLETLTCGAKPVDLVLVTCEYEQGDQSTHNLVVAAQLVSSRNR